MMHRQIWSALAVALAAGVSFVSQLPADDGVPGTLDADGVFHTGVPTELAIRGGGWFVLKDPVRGDVFLTRKGEFRLDSEGYLIGTRGYRVQGESWNFYGQYCDIVIDDRVRPATTFTTATIDTFNVATNGEVQLFMNDGTEYARARVVLQAVAQPERLERIETGLYTATPEAGLSQGLTRPGEAGAGIIISSALLLERTPPQLKLLGDGRVRRITTEGLATRTFQRTDVALRGPGSFAVRDARTGELFATRAGLFLVDSNGFLITYDRKRLQGWTNGPTAGLSDLRLADGDANPLLFPYFLINQAGELTCYYNDGTFAIRGQIGVFKFAHPEILIAQSLGLFAGFTNAGPSPVLDLGGLRSGETSLMAGAIELVNLTPDLLHRRRQLSFFPQEALQRTTNATDLALDGDGFFQLRHPRTNQRVVTRNGAFRLDANNFLTDRHGWRLQGWRNPALTELGDLQVDLHGLLGVMETNVSLDTFSVGLDGVITIHLSDGRELARGQVLLQSFGESFNLRPVGAGRFANLAAAAPTPLSPAGIDGLGQILSSAISIPNEPEQLTMPPRDGFRLAISGEAGSHWNIEVTEDFAHWETIAVLTNAPSNFEFCDRTAHLHPNRFYRIRGNYGPLVLPQFWSDGGW